MLFRALFRNRATCRGRHCNAPMHFPRLLCYKHHMQDGLRMLMLSFCPSMGGTDSNRIHLWVIWAHLFSHPFTTTMRNNEFERISANETAHQKPKKKTLTAYEGFLLHRRRTPKLENWNWEPCNDWGFALLVLLDLTTWSQSRYDLPHI